MAGGATSRIKVLAKGIALSCSKQLRKGKSRGWPSASRHGKSKPETQSKKYPDQSNASTGKPKEEQEYPICSIEGVNMFDANANDRNANALNEEVPMATSVSDTCPHCGNLKQDEIEVQRTTTVNSKVTIRRVPAKNPVPCGPSENVSKPVDCEMASEGNDKTCEPETDLDGVSEKASVTSEEAVEETDEVAIEETDKEIIEETKEETNESMMDLRDCSEKASEINDQIHALATAILWRKGGNEVCIAGTHNDWRKEPMTKLADGSFEHSCKFMHGKMHEFKFFVDGKWQFADDQPKIPDPYGSFNNVLDLTSSVEVN